MRKLLSLPAILISLLITTGVKAQDATGLPGDNFSLEGALEMFKKAANPEQFEKILNTKENGVNNLDLNRDGEIDYIRVINKKDGNVQVFVLQALVSKRESQDIAVIQLEKTNERHAVIQIVGDEDIYGVSRIVEPTPEDVTAFNYPPVTDRPHGPSAYAPSGIVVNVWFWPSVQFVFAPYYTVWESPWYWDYHPGWWDPWQPLSWHAYQPICYRYRPMYVVVHTHRIVRAPHIYRPMRVYSRTVHTRNRVVVNNYRRTASVNTPRREFNRTSANTPRREMNRGSSNAPRREMNRGSSNTPRREMNRSSNTTRPEINRGSSNAPRREINRGSNTQRPEINRGSSNAPRREINRGSNTPRPQISERSSAPRQQINQRSSAPRREVNQRSSAPRQQINQRSSAPRQQISERSSAPRREVNQRSSAPRQQINQRSSAPRQQINQRSSAPRREMNRSSAPSRGRSQGAPTRRT